MRRVLCGSFTFLALIACSGEGESTQVPGAADPGPSNSSDRSGTPGPSLPTGADGGSGPRSDAGQGGDSGPAPTANNGFPAKWIDGTACPSEAKLQVWKYDDHTVILRQSLCTNFEAPFMYLLLGTDKALLVDTGTGAVNVQAEVQALVGTRALVVAHSHGHGDHVGGDGQFAGKPKTTVVGTQTNAVRAFFGLKDNAPVAYDLGGRIVDVLPIPGHQAAHVAFYDRSTKIMLTGDTLYPGRLYIDDFTAYKASVARLVSFVDAGHDVAWVLGAHIELAAAGNGQDFAQGSKAHPGEHVLQLKVDELRDLAALVGPMNTPKRTVRPHFTLSP